MLLQGRCPGHCSAWVAQRPWVLHVVQRWIRRTGSTGAAVSARVPLQNSTARSSSTTKNRKPDLPPASGAFFRRRADWNSVTKDGLCGILQRAARHSVSRHPTPLRIPRPSTNAGVCFGFWHSGGWDIAHSCCSCPIGKRFRAAMTRPISVCG